jgi:hypothetical protein
MGFNRLDSTSWAGYTATHSAGRARAAVFTAKTMKPDYDPAKFDVRESRNSAINPHATPIILASDVTGSMGALSKILLDKAIPTIAGQLYDRKPVSDPHIMVASIGDMECDRAPIQATQFEADISLASQIRELWLEGGGGGNMGESYSVAHLLAAFKTSADAWEKENRKGILFTIGDEPILPVVRKGDVKRFFGIDLERDMTAEECVRLAERHYHVFHIVLRGGYAAHQHGMDEVLASWKPILPQRTMICDDADKLGEIIVSAIQVVTGADHATVARTWSGDTALVVANAIKDLTVGGAGRGVRRLDA